MKQYVKKFTVGALIAIILAFIFSWLIIFVTPLLYRCHPFINKDTQKAENTINSTFVNDTIYITKEDSVVNLTISVMPSDTTLNTDEESIEKLGTFGDSAGFWNAIFSALAMIGVLVTIVYQSHKDRHEEERANIAKFQEQCLTMLSMLTDIVSQLRINPNYKPSFDYAIPQQSGWSNGVQQIGKTNEANIAREHITGRACFKYIYDERPGGKSIGAYIAQKIANNPQSHPSEDVYRSLRKITENHFDHYFRTLYRILKFIKDYDLGRCDKKKQQEVKDLCADLIRAQLSTYELAVLYYNGLYPKFRTSSKEIYEYFCLFDNLDPQILISPAEQEYYDYVRTHNKNPNQYDKNIHYDKGAFSNSTVTHRENKKNTKLRFYNIKNRISFKSLINFVKGKAQKQTSSKIDNEDAQIIYNILKQKSGENIKIKKLQEKGQMNEQKVKEAIKYLKSHGFIKVRKGSNGNKYDILK